MKILMVCLGNICRSPLAEGLLRLRAEEAGLGWEVDSAGTERYHIGEAPHPFSQQTALRHGFDISAHRARRITKADLQRFDRIYAMAPDVYREIREIGGRDASMARVELLMNEVYPGRDMPVPDPWYGPRSGYQHVYELLDQACRRLIDKYGRPGLYSPRPGERASAS